MGVRTAGPLPGQVVRHLRLALDHPAGRTGRRTGGAPAARRPAAAVPRRRGRRGRRHRAGRVRSADHRAAQRPCDRRAAVLHHVLDRGAAARTHDGERGLPADRRPVRVRHRERPGARAARLPAGADLGAGASRWSCRTGSGPSWRTATRWSSPPGPPARKAPASAWARSAGGWSPPPPTPPEPPRRVRYPCRARRPAARALTPGVRPPVPPALLPRTSPASSPRHR